MKPGLSGFPGTGTARRRYGSPAPGGSIFTTSAPKSDITVAAAGPAIKLAQSITFNPSKTRSPIIYSSLGQAVGVAVPDDMAGGPAGEMCADDEDRIIGETGQTALACQPRLGRVAVRRRRPLRMGDLARVMHEIAGDQRLLALRGDPHADMTGSMAQGRNEAHLVADPMIGLDEIDEPGLPDRHHRVAEHRRHVLALVLAGPVCEFDAAHQVARVWERRDPPTLD